MEKENDFLLLKITNFYPKIPVYIQNITYSKSKKYDETQNKLVINLYFLYHLKSIIFSTSIKNKFYLTFIQNLILSKNFLKKISKF